MRGRALTKDVSIGVELNSGYFKDGLAYLKEAEAGRGSYTMFDWIREQGAQ